MHLNSSGGECVMDEKPFYKNKVNNVLTASGLTAVQQLLQPNYRRFYSNNKKKQKTKHNKQFIQHL